MTTSSPETSLERMATVADMPAWPLARPAYSSLAAAVQGEASRWNVPGMTVAVFHDGELEEVATGVTSIATRQPMRADALFQIGSISKVFATTLAMTLVDEGTLDLDEPVLTYVPELPVRDPEARKTITMRHLLSHSSGLEGDRFGNYGRGDDASAIAIAKFDQLEQWFAPGELYAYCNTGFYLVGLITERLTGKTWEAALQERVLDPWKLEQTVLFAEDAITRPHAVGHNLPSRESGFTIARPYWNRRHATPAGGVLSTVGDLVRFAQAHLNDGELDGGRVLKAETAHLMKTPFMRAGIGENYYGQGWHVDLYDGHTEIGHGGATDGFRAHLTAIPERGFVIAQLTNADTGAAAMESIEAWALEHFLQIRHPEPEPIALSADELDAVTGSYSRHAMKTQVTRVDDHLEVSIAFFDAETGQEEGTRVIRAEPIAPREANAFRVPEGPFLGMIVQFIKMPTADDPDRLLMRAGGRLSGRNALPTVP